MAADKRQRTCASCGKKAKKDELFRLVRDQQGTVSIDPVGTKAGRGAYVCSENCLKQALDSGRMQRVLRIKITQEDCERIILGFNKMIREVQES